MENLFLQWRNSSEFSGIFEPWEKWSKLETIMRVENSKFEYSNFEFVSEFWSPKILSLFFCGMDNDLYCFFHLFGL